MPARFQSSASSDQDRGLRRAKEMSRLRRNAAALIAAYPAISPMDVVEADEDAVRSYGFDPDDFALFRVRARARQVTLICIPTRLWTDPVSMVLFMKAKSAIGYLGRDAILVPQSFIQRQPRLDNAIMIHRAADLDIAPTDRMAILAHLIENASGSLSDLATLVRGPDPVSAVLHLVTAGVLQIDLDRTFLPTSTLTMAEGAR